MPIFLRNNKIFEEAKSSQIVLDLGYQFVLEKITFFDSNTFKYNLRSTKNTLIHH